MTRPRYILCALLGVIALELLWSVSTRRDTVELERAAAEGEPAERALAMHVLANRDEPHIHGLATTRALLEGEDALLREFAMTYDFARGDGAALQREIYDANPDQVRMNFFMRHQKLPMHRTKVGIYFGAPEPD